MSSQVTIQFANDQTGKNIDVQLTPDGKDHKVSELVANAHSDLAFVTTVQLLANRENVVAVLKVDGKQVGNDLDGNADNVERIEKTAVGHLSVSATRK